MLGLTFIKGMRRKGRKYRDGTILDPRNGVTYNGEMDLSRDGQSLTVRGYFAIPLLGASEVWHRVNEAAGPFDKSETCSCLSNRNVQ